MYSLKILIVLCVVTAYGALADDWWEHEVFYQIYPRSFYDSDGDGVGDLQGIKQKLPHLKDAGITAAWLSPIFKSPMVDFGYDISDFRAIHEEFGTIEDFEELSAEAQKLGIKLILDFVPNHTSDKHRWFELSANRTPGYEDYYVWNDGVTNVDGTRKPPNNWLSNFGGPAWTFHKDRGQYYLHQFAVQQPDLNYRNPKVVQEMKDIMVYWLDKGIAGFRADAVPFLFEKSDLEDEPRSYDPNALSTDYAYLQHIYTNNLPETYDMIHQWRVVLDDYTNKTDGITRIMMTEAYADIKHQVEYYGDEHVARAHFTFNFLMITDLNGNATAHDFMFTIYKWLSYMPIKYTPNWVLGNHDNHRVGTRYGRERIDGLNMLLMIMPGVAVTYYGDEIGMVDGYISWEDTKDPQGINAGKDRYQLFSRDPERTPFQWDDSENAGFSTANKTWLPVADNYKTLNLANEKKATTSHFKLYQRLIKLRKKETLLRGELDVKALSENILTVVRQLDGHESYVLVFNLGKSNENVHLADYYVHLPDKMSVKLASVGASIAEGTSVATAGITVGPNEAYILSS